MTISAQPLSLGSSRHLSTNRTVLCVLCGFSPRSQRFEPFFGIFASPVRSKAFQSKIKNLKSRFSPPPPLPVQLAEPFPAPIHTPRAIPRREPPPPPAHPA